MEDNMSEELKNGCFTHIHEVPDEVLEYIFAFLVLKDRIKTEMVCRRWRWLGKCRQWSWPKMLLLRELDECRLSYFKSNSTLAVYPPLQNYIDLQTGDTSAESLRYVLSSLMSRCGTSLTQLEIGWWDCRNQKLLDMVIEIIALNCPNLTSIKLVNVPLSGANVLSLGRHCSKLKTARLLNGAEIDEEALMVFFEACESLECFDTQFCWKIVTGSCFDAINVNVEIVRLKDCKTLEPAALKRLMLRCERLKELCLTNCCRMDQITLFQVFNHYKETLKILCLDQYSVNNDWYEGLGVLHNLKELSVSGCTRVGDKLCLIVAQNCLKLKRLDISNTSVTDKGIGFLTSAISLTELDISETRIHGKGIKDLAMQRRLENLNAATCPYVSEANATFSFLADWCPNLRILDVSGIRGVSNWLVDAYCRAISGGLLKGPLRLVVADTCVSNDVTICQGLEVVGNTYWEPKCNIIPFSYMA